MSVARADGIGEEVLPHAATAETMAGTNSEYMEDPEGKRVPQQFKPSMLVDLEHGRPMEVEVIVGAIVRKAKELGVPIPQYVILKLVAQSSCVHVHAGANAIASGFRLDMVYASLKVMQAGLLRHSRKPS